MGERQERCFYETRVSFDQCSLANGQMLVGSGFAKRNFNYRIESVGVNLVGSAIRNCEGSSLPSQCYSGASVPFTLEHVGEYGVLKHLGETYKSDLQNGRIQCARALGAERYLTNPISSDDSQLISGYMRRELTGRPLSGAFIMRLWEVQGFSWENAADIQLVLGYRYWTANN